MLSNCKWCLPMKREAWRLTICAIFLMIVMGGALYNFGLLLLQKLHSMIIKFKTSSELVAVGRDCCKHVNDEELITVFAGVESLLNFRPLTYQSSDPREDVPLTPNHFLQGQTADRSGLQNSET